MKTIFQSSTTKRQVLPDRGHHGVEAKDDCAAGVPVRIVGHGPVPKLHLVRFCVVLAGPVFRINRVLPKSFVQAMAVSYLRPGE